MAWSDWCCGSGDCTCCVETTIDAVELDSAEYQAWKAAQEAAGCTVTEERLVREQITPDVTTDATISGDATALSSTEVRLTPDDNQQAGSAMLNQQFDWTVPFEMAFDANFGTNNDTNLGDGDVLAGFNYHVGGADGIAFVIHNDPAGPSAVGDPGLSIGAGRIQNGLAIEFDTFDNTPFGSVEDPNNNLVNNPDGSGFSKREDHTSAWLTGPNDPFTPLPGVEVTGIGEIEDGAWHNITVSWEPTTQLLEWSFNGTVVGSATVDVPAILGSDEGFFGWTSSTGGLRNEQSIRNIGFTSFEQAVKVIVECPNEDCPTTLETASGSVDMLPCGCPGCEAVDVVEGVDEATGGKTFSVFLNGVLCQVVNCINKICFTRCNQQIVADGSVRGLARYGTPNFDDATVSIAGAFPATDPNGLPWIAGLNESDFGYAGANDSWDFLYPNGAMERLVVEGWVNVPHCDSSGLPVESVEIGWTKASGWLKAGTWVAVDGDPANATPLGIEPAFNAVYTSPTVTARPGDCVFVRQYIADDVATGRTSVVWSVNGAAAEPIPLSSVDSTGCAPTVSTPEFWTCENGLCLGPDGKEITQSDMEALTPAPTQTSCDNVPPCAHMAYTGHWEAAAPDACQRYVVDEVWKDGVDVTADATITLNGVGGNSIDQPRDGNVDVSASVDDCTIAGTERNTVDVSATLWEGSGARVVSTTNAQGVGVWPINTNDPSMPARFIVQRNGRNWDSFVGTNELARMRYGNAANPQQLFIGPVDVDTLCDPVVEWGLDLTEAHTMQPGDILTVSLEFYDSTGHLIEKRQVEQLVDDFGNTLVSGSEVPPAGTASVATVVESNTQGSAREHRVRLNTVNTFIRLA